MINPPGGMELVIIVLVILLLFGGKKIPELARGLGKGIREFKDGLKDGDEASRKELNEKEKSEGEKPS
jgi:sec-independent protein translocase protein TatA